MARVSESTQSHLCNRYCVLSGALIMAVVLVCVMPWVNLPLAMRMLVAVALGVIGTLFLGAIASAALNVVHRR